MKLIVPLLALSLCACAISTGPLAPEGELTPSGAEPTPPPNPVAGTLTEKPQADYGADIQKARLSIDRMAQLVAGLAAYQRDNGAYPRVDTARDLRIAIVPTYLDDVPTADGWNRPFRYQATDDGRGYLLISAGSDGEFDQQSWSVERELSNPADDIVFRTGVPFRVWPRG